jgi:hypothetical protein
MNEQVSFTLRGRNPDVRRCFYEAPRTGRTLGRGASAHRLDGIKLIQPRRVYRSYQGLSLLSKKEISFYPHLFITI